MEYDVVIIGSGVAGLTAALYASRANKNVLIIEEYNIGGTAATLDKIENYPGFDEISGFDLVQNIYSQTIKFGTNYEFSAINLIDFDNNLIKTDTSDIKYKTLIIASGTSYNRLNIVNEDKFKHKGISYCAVCDGSLFKNKNIVVVTNGNIGSSSIDYLSNLSSHITILDFSNSYKNKDLQIYNNVFIKNLLGDDSLRSIEFESNDCQYKIDVDGLFVCLGKSTNLDLFKNLESKNGYLLTDENMKTKLENVFVAGDIRYKNLRQIVTACSDGAIAATEAIKYLSIKK